MIVAAGEALMDVVAGEHRPGGAAFNVARTIARLGGDVAFLGCLSTDAHGRALRAALNGVDLSPVRATDLPTTLAHAELDAKGSATYRFEGESAFALTDAELPPCDVLYAGALGLVFEPMASTLERLMARAPRVAVDVNVRPDAIADEAAYRARLRRLRPDVVKVSDDDVAWLGSTPEAPTVLVTHGADGATVNGVHVPAPRVEVADTIGAGDAFMGAFLAHGGDPVDATRFACAEAARTLTARGGS